MPQFTPWTVQSPFPNVLYNPAAVDKSIAESQSLLGELDVNRQKLGLEREKLDQERAAGAAWLKSGDGTGAAPSGDTTPFEQQMGSAEGGADPAAVNKQGYAGQFQFGAGRLADLGLYTPAPGEDLKSNQWKGTFHIAPYNVASLDDFLHNPAAQHAAFVAHVGDIDKTIDATPGADKFNRDGLRAVAHLGGTGGMQAFVASGGNLDRADANGTSLKNYYQRFAQGGAPLLQKTFGSVHGPGGPPSPPPVRLAGPRATQPGAGAVDANGIAVPTPTLMPDPGPGATAPPVVTSDADTSPIAPSQIALRTGGTDTAGPGAGQTTLPTVETPNRMYQTGLPGITIGGPGNPLAPPGAAPGAIAPPPQQQAATPSPTAQRPALPPPPPAASRSIPLEPLLQSGPGQGLTPSQFKIAGSMIAAGTPIAQVMSHVEQWRQANLSNRQQAATAAAVEQQQNYDRQRQYQQDTRQAQQDAETARRNAAADARAEQTAKNAGLPPGYRMDDRGVATRIDGLPPDPAVAQAAKDAFDADQRKQPFQGTGSNEQNRNVLIAGTKSGQVDSPEYASAYTELAAPRYNMDGSFTKPNMAPYAKPTFKPPGATEVPDYSSQETPVPTILTMEQGKVAGFADRLRQALPVISDTSDAAMNRWQIMLGKAPLLGNQLISPEFQLHQQAERNFINAVLRRESGAAIASDEFTQARQQYIPQPGDSPQVLAQKKQNRDTVLAGMTREAGPGYKPAGGAGTPGGPSAAPGGTKPPPPGFKVIQ